VSVHVRVSVLVTEVRNGIERGRGGGAKLDVSVHVRVLFANFYH
jgi:hypothetical protein